MIMTEIFPRNRVLPKIKTGFLLIGILFGMTACSSPAGEVGTEISVLKDGSIHMQIAESFDKPYYDKDELQQSILEEAASYNREMGSGNITVEKITVEENVAQVKMNYASAADYAAFNECIFFIGSAQEAVDAGFDLNTVLSGVKDELETIGMSDMLAMTDYRILITDCTDDITLDGKAAYVSDNVFVSKNGKNIVLVAEGAPAYVMFQ